MRQKQIHNRSVVLTINKSWAGARRRESGSGQLGMKNRLRNVS